MWPRVLESRQDFLKVVRVLVGLDGVFCKLGITFGLEKPIFRLRILKSVILECYQFSLYEAEITGHEDAGNLAAWAGSYHLVKGMKIRAFNDPQR